MLSKQTVEDLIKSNVISIGYYYYLEGNVVKQLNDSNEEQFVDVVSKNKAYELFSKNYRSDRLILTVGPLVYSHSYGFKKGRKNFKNIPNIFDLRECDDHKISIQPNETIIINTNERIILNKSVANVAYDNYYGAYIIPSVSFSESGLFCVPSYIDSCWDGILQINITNVSSEQQDLKMFEKIEICRFYKIDGEVHRGFIENYAANSHHYGQNWENIMHGNQAPFRRGKTTYNTKTPFVNKIIYGWGLIKKYYKEISLVAFLTGAFLIYKTIDNFVDTSKSLRSQIPVINTKLEGVPSFLKIDFPINNGNSTSFVETKRISNIPNVKSIKDIIYTLNDPTSFSFKKFPKLELQSLSDTEIEFTLSGEFLNKNVDKSILQFKILLIRQ